MLNVMPVPIQSVRACHAGKIIIHFIIFTFIVFMIFGCKNPISDSGNFTNTNNKMYVYSNSGNTFYLLDYKTFEVVKEIQFPVSDTVSYYGMTISTNRDYLFFA